MAINEIVSVTLTPHRHGV